jgi:2-polyprenyl-3-methyl-5-hydroxy-6-metoxy-1,4-benzoquinol methylase
MSKLDEVKHRFEWDAGNFSAIYSGSSFTGRWFQRLFRKAIFVRYDVAMTESGDVQGKSILDIGCGSGVYCIELAKRGAKRVLGIDFSDSMLAIAREAARKDGVADRIEFIRGEFTGHDFGNEKFDVSIAMGVFDYLEDPAPFLTKMSTVTSGKVLASFPRYSLLRGTARRLRYRLSRRGDVFYYTPDEVDGLAERAHIMRHRLIHVASSGGGVILVGDNQR